jgi:hypothetical protein
MFTHVRRASFRLIVTLIALAMGGCQSRCGITVPESAPMLESSAAQPVSLDVASPVAEAPLGASCKPGGVSCGPGAICVNETAEAHCRSIPQRAPILFQLPFEPTVEVVCTHASGVGSHSWKNALFALDLANAYQDPPARIVAAADGEAFVYLGDDGQPCAQPPGDAAVSAEDVCGRGWGNRVKILHDGGYVSFYVHLASISVRMGQKVRAGDVLGVEGWTGRAGHRHLHFSVQRMAGQFAEEWRRALADQDDGKSVPFSLSAMLEGKPALVDASAITCAHAGIGFAPRAQQPHLQSLPGSPFGTAAEE